MFNPYKAQVPFKAKGYLKWLLYRNNANPRQVMHLNILPERKLQSNLCMTIIEANYSIDHVVIVVCERTKI